MAWLMANWQTIVVALLAVDKALLALFPNSSVLDGALSSIGTFIQGLLGNTSPPAAK